MLTDDDKNYDELVKINYNPNWPYVRNNLPYAILIISGSGSGMTNMLLNLKKHQQSDVDKIYLLIKDPFKSKFQLLINARENLGIRHVKNPKAFIDYSHETNDVYENLEDYNLTKKKKW